MAGLDDGRPATRLSPVTRGLHAATEECARSPRALPASPRSRESPRELEMSSGSDRLATIAKAAVAVDRHQKAHTELAELGRERN